MSFSMVEREIFDRVKKHLLQQNAQSNMVDPNGEMFCVYRSKNGLKCAVGALISDEAYNRNGEHLGIGALECKNGKWEVPDNKISTRAAACALAKMLNDSGIPATDGILKLLDELQYIHDMLSPEDWPAALDELEKNF